MVLRLRPTNIKCCLELHAGVLPCEWCAQGLLTQQKPPAAIMLELHSDLLEQYNYPGGAAALLHHLHTQGYSEISHSG